LGQVSWQVPEAIAGAPPSPVRLVLVPEQFTPTAAQARPVAASKKNQMRAEPFIKKTSLSSRVLPGARRAGAK
jgi:hypothetical protein